MQFDWLFSRILEFWKPYLAVILASLSINLIGLGIPLFAMNVYDRVVPNNAFDTLWALTIGVAIALSIDFLLRLSRSVILEIAGRTIDISSSSDLVKSVLTAPFSRQLEKKPFIVQSFFEVSPLRDVLSSTALSVLVDLPFVAIYLVAIYMIGGSVVWVPLIGILSICILSIAGHKAHKSSVQASAIAEAQKRALSVEILGNVTRIKSMDATDWFGSRWIRQMENSSRAMATNTLLSAVVSNLTLVVIQGSYVGTIVYGVYLISNLQMTMGGLIAVSILSSRSLSPLVPMFALLGNLDRSKNTLEELGVLLREAYTARKAKAESAGDLRLFKAITSPNTAARIELRSASFAYNDFKPAISELSLTIKPGEHVGIIGPIGSGKTTLFNILTSALYPTSGSFLINGIEPSEEDTADYRACLAAVEQENSLFNGTLADNLALGRELPDSNRLETIARLTGLDEILKKLPKGLSTDVGADGENLSGGQRQIVKLTRALLMDRPIAILDEPTASLDHETEALLLANLKDYWRDRSLIIFTHRRPPLALVDRIIVLSDGKVFSDMPASEMERRFYSKSAERLASSAL